MTQWLKKNWFKFGLLAILMIIGASISFYLFYLAKINNLKLQEMCSQEAAKYFNKQNYVPVSSPDLMSTYTYSNHYNYKLNKCFVRIDTMVSMVNPYSGEKSTTLYDVNENVVVASFYQSHDAKGVIASPCLIGEDMCKSDDEFEKRIKPYLEQ